MQIIILLLASLLTTPGYASSRSLQKAERQCRSKAIEKISNLAKREYSAQVKSDTVKVIFSKTYLLDRLHVIMYEASVTDGTKSFPVKMVVKRKFFSKSCF